MTALKGWIEAFPDNPAFLEIANEAYREPGIYESVVARFFEKPNVKVIRGYLPGSLDITCPERIAFLHIDLNSAGVEIGVLDRLFDRVSAAASLCSTITAGRNS
jgi:hypothetical protein